MLQFLLDLEIPQTDGRLRIPYLDSKEKQSFIKSISGDEVSEFMDEYYTNDPDGKVAFSSIYDAYSEEGEYMSKIGFSRKLKELGYKEHRGTNNVKFIINLKER